VSGSGSSRESCAASAAPGAAAPRTPSRRAVRCAHQRAAVLPGRRHRLEEQAVELVGGGHVEGGDVVERGGLRQRGAAPQPGDPRRERRASDSRGGEPRRALARDGPDEGLLVADQEREQRLAGGGRA
jgi:hypothetical protein